ncbi:MAG: hypothetical protein GC171_15820 [Terrimonas sp.]|nr:hypothetical protein [Terrimonas sp.]
MRKLSFWAKRNPCKSRVIIIGGHLALFLLAWYIGSGLADIDVIFPEPLLFLFVGLFWVTAFIYPAKGHQPISKNKFYQWRKGLDFSLALLSFLMMTAISNNYSPGENSFSAKIYAAYTSSLKPKKDHPTAEEILASLEHRDKSTLTRTEKRILKKEFKHQLGIYAKAKLTGNKDTAANAGLIILAIIAALGLLYLVAALACSLSCNGSDGAAIALALLGTAGIVIGFILVINRITRGPKYKKPVTEVAPE